MASHADQVVFDDMRDISLPLEQGFPPNFLPSNFPQYQLGTVPQSANLFAHANPPATPIQSAYTRTMNDTPENTSDYYLSMSTHPDTFSMRELSSSWSDVPFGDCSHNAIPTTSAHGFGIGQTVASESGPAPQYHASLTSPPDHVKHHSEMVIIGVILSNGIPRHDKYKCHIPNCTGIKTFSRLADLKRHNASKHNRQGAHFWCPVDGCDRSLKSGGRAFPRKDKMYDHLERVHADKVGTAEE